MKIGLIDVDGVMPNLALMKLSTWHKAQGDSVQWFNPLFHKCDKIYASKIFKDSPAYGYAPDGTVYGGTGISLELTLPECVENCDPDYSIYPACNFTLQMFSRGCIRRCAWCVVPEKEGKIRPVEAMLPNEKGEWIEVLDNNFFANPLWREAIECLQDCGQPVSFHGIDARTVFEKQADALLSLKHKTQIHIAWDDPAYDMMPHLKRCAELIPPYKLMCYVLIGFNSTKEQDLERVMKLKELKIDPYIMSYDDSDKYQQDFERWVNMKATFNSCTWEEYSGPKKKKKIPKEQMSLF